MRSFLLAAGVSALLTACATSSETSTDEPVADTVPTTTATAVDETATVPTNEAGGDGGEAEEGAEQRFPDVIDAEVTAADDGTFDVSATLSSPYDTPERYADAWRVLAPDGTELGVRELTHDHAAEQPFTRSLSGVEIPDGVDTVVIEGRDQANGWGGATVEVPVPR